MLREGDSGARRTNVGTALASESGMGTDPIAALRELGRDYHHVQQEHERESESGSTRRRLAGEMQQLAARFERLLSHWVSEDALRDRWRAFLYGREPAPAEPRMAPPPLLKGTTKGGAPVEIRPADDGGYDVYVGGAHAEHHDVPWRSEPERLEPVRIGNETCEERFDASPEALDALASFLSRRGAEPPWAWARELVADGLVNTELALTPRGARALERHRGGAPAPEAWTTYCIVAAGAARARVLTLDGTNELTEPTLSQLVEVSDLANPALRAKDTDLFSDSRPGLNRAGRDGPSHGLSDHRNERRREIRRRFADLTVDEAARVWREHPSAKVVIAASPAVLGELRSAIARRSDAPHELVELRRDVARLAPAAMHDALAEAGVLPPRGRLPPPAA